MPTSKVNGAANTYTFSLETVIPLLDGDRLSFTLPKQLTAPETAAELNCLPIGTILKAVTCQVSGPSRP